MRELSSRFTAWIKYVIPSGCVAGMICMGFWLGLSPRHPAESLIAFCIPAVPYCFLVWWPGRALKRVRMDDEALYVFNYFHEIRIPLSDMAQVTEIVGLKVPRWGGNRVTITLAHDTEFGRKIAFIPRGSRPGERDPIVRELKGLIRPTDR